MATERTAIVTGAGKRVGAVIARALVADGWTVVGHVHHAEDPGVEGATRIVADLNDSACAETIFDAAKALPPVDQWDPRRCGHSGMRIARDGTWYHEGAPIERPAMVRLFSTVLRREPDGRHVLVTPAEKLDIDVESTAFRAIKMSREGDGRGQRIAFGLDSGDAVILGHDHPLRIVETESGPSPRLLVRNGLEAGLARPVYYELAELALAGDDKPAGVWSDGDFFPLEPAA